MILTEREIIIFCTEITFIGRAVPISAKGSANYTRPLQIQGGGIKTGPFATGSHYGAT